MPQRKSGLKELRTNRKRRLHNLDIKTDLRKTIKDFEASVEQKNAKEAKSKLKLVFKKLDKATKRNLLHKNTTSRRKAKFTKAVTALS